MNRVLRVSVIRLIALILTATLAGGCAAFKEGQSRKEKEGEGAKDSISLKPGYFPSSLLPTLEITAEPCYVFLKPRENAPRFGPLAKGERIKWLDAQGRWVRVWIPRLRVSGWVAAGKVHEASEPTWHEDAIPENVLSAVSVTVPMANIRAAPTTGSAIIAGAKKDEQFRILNRREGWYQIWIPELKKRGWISGRIVTKRP